MSYINTCTLPLTCMHTHYTPSSLPHIIPSLPHHTTLFLHTSLTITHNVSRPLIHTQLVPCCYYDLHTVHSTEPQNLDLPSSDVKGTVPSLDVCREHTGGLRFVRSMIVVPSMQWCE